MIHCDKSPVVCHSSMMGSDISMKRCDKSAEGSDAAMTRYDGSPGGKLRIIPCQVKPGTGNLRYREK